MDIYIHFAMALCLLDSFGSLHSAFSYIFKCFLVCRCCLVIFSDSSARFCVFQTWIKDKTTLILTDKHFSPFSFFCFNQSLFKSSFVVVVVVVLWFFFSLLMIEFSNSDFQLLFSVLWGISQHWHILRKSF